MTVPRKAIRSMRFENLSFAFEGAPAIFSNMTLSVPSSPVLWVRSPSGKGKSTFLRLLAGLLTPSSGNYLINDQVVNEMSFEEFLPYRLAIGYGFDMGGLLNNRTLAENLILPLLFHKLMTQEAAQKRIEQITDFFEMSALRDLRPYSVSGSQRKLSCVLRAFIHDPQIVLLDEPEIGLKEDSLKKLTRFIEDSLAQGRVRQLILCGESRHLVKHLAAQEFHLFKNENNERAAA